jgi:superfamily II DNA/RNA helicase
MQLAAEALQYANRDGSDSSTASELLEQLGAPALGIWQGLDTTKRSQQDQGRFLLYDVFQPTLQDLISRIDLHSAESTPVIAWFVSFMAASRLARAKLFTELMGQEAPTQINEWIQSVSWPQGLQELDYPARQNGSVLPSLLPASAAGLRRLTSALDFRLSTEEPHVEPFDYDRPFDRLVPPDMASVLTARMQRLRTYKLETNLQGRSVDGIDDRGFTDILREGLPVLRTRLAEHKSFLIIGPTTTGKTDFSRIAASHIIWQKRKVIVLLPTKALVSQAAEEWRALFASCQSSENWRLLEASRDHPYNDEDIARGDYNIVLAIPEKLAAYLAGGSRILDQCGLLVVDELQTLNQRQRGANIESLLTIIRTQYPNLPIMGLSATLTSQSSRTVRRWLDVGDSPAEGFIVTDKRPVDLDRYATSLDTWRKRSQHNAIADGQWASSANSDLREMLRKRLRRAAHRDAVELACRLLPREDAVDDAKSILIFVGSRRAAETVTAAMQSALDMLEVGEAGEWRSPHRGRFGRLVLSAEEAAERDKDFFRLPNLPATQDVRSGLSTGVMYHNARLDPEHRRIIEHAFSDKIIRVLVATATLAVGMNLPADFVIVADITDGTGKFQDDLPVERLLDPHDMAQRFGRCGRLGMSTIGEAYVLVQRSTDRKRLLELSANQAETFKVGDEADDGATMSQELTHEVDSRMAAIDGVFTYFVMSDDTGDSVNSNLDARGFARLLLQDVCRHSPALSIEELDSRVERIYEHSLLKIEDRSKPATLELVEMLDSEQLLAPAPEDVSKWKITGLGRTVALSNVPVTNSRAIRAVAEAALLGAGPLTVLSIAAQADYVRDLTWLRLPYESSSELTAQMRSRMWQVVRAFVSPETANPRAFVAPDFLDVIRRETALVGYGAPAQSLRGRVSIEVERQPDATIVSHFRACIAILWLKGYPTNSLISFIERNTASTVRGRTRSVDAYPADIRDLGERLSYVLNAASEVLRVDPENNRHLTLKDLAEALQSGMPYQLAPMLRLREPRIHRERLVTLLDMREDALDFDDLPGVLATLGAPRSDRSAQQKRAHLNLSFSGDEVAAILRNMTRADEREGAKALPPDLRDEKIPTQLDVEGSVTYGRVASDMVAKQSLEAKVSELTFVLEQFGLRVQSQVGSDHALLTLQRDDPAECVEIYLLGRRLERSMLPTFEGERRTIVAMAGISLGAEHAMRASVTPGFSCMTMWVFLSVLARIDRSWRVTYFGPDPDTELALRVLRFFGKAMGPVSLSDASLAEVAAGLPAPPPLFIR